MRGTLLAILAGAAVAATGCTDSASRPLPDESVIPTVPRGEQPSVCPTDGAALQVLGSGGPIAEGSRAATSYLLWIDGEARLLIDAGSGSFVRFAEAGGSLANLDAILLTHLHADHSGDLIDILNTGGFEGRTTPLPIIGPDAAPRFPGTGEFLLRLLSKESGAFAYNGGYLDGSENKSMIEARDIVTQEGQAGPIGLDVSNDYSVMAHPVHHGPVPALGFAIKLENASFVITGDQSFLSEQFLADLTGGKPTILFAHHVINGEAGQPRGLHRTPEQIGELAAALETKRLVLTHNMERSLEPIADSLNAIAKSYAGDVSVADDLDCYVL
ncbi:MAG: MBL fold metallo-hydrolase [Erythrobacter sp.]